MENLKDDENERGINAIIRTVTRRDNWGGGGEYSYIRVLPDGFLLKAIVFTVCEHDYMNIHPPPRIIASIVTAQAIIYCFSNINTYSVQKS